MDHDKLVELLENLDSDLVASDLEKMSPESLTQLLALYNAGAEAKGNKYSMDSMENAI